MTSKKRVALVKDEKKALIEAVAGDIGKEVCAYVEVMYPDVWQAGNSGFKLSLRNIIRNEFVSAMEQSMSKEEILERLETRRQFRRDWVAQYRKLRRPKIE